LVKEKKKRKKISFFSQTKVLDLSNLVRDSKLEELLNYTPNSDFDIEDYIYTEDERDKLHLLRNNIQSNEDPLWKILNKELLNVKKEYSESFHIGQKVWYNNEPGYITFKHLDKVDNNQTRWSVKVKDTEFRYVNGLELFPRKVEDLSHIEIDPDLNKLSTEKLLKIMKRKRKNNRGQADLKIKRILQDREHVRVTEDRIINKG
jgi:hypothetical protein